MGCDAVALKGKLADHVDPLVITLGVDGYSMSVFQAASALAGFLRAAWICFPISRKPNTCSISL